MPDSDPAITRFLHAARDRLQQQRELHRFRTRRVTSASDSAHVTVDGKRLVNFASNDYLGLAHDRRVVEAGALAARHAGVGAAAAPLITGYTTYHQTLEQELARMKHAESAVLFPSGYQANVGLVQTLAKLAEGGQPVRFLIDKLVHGSIVDAIQRSGLPYRVFPHHGYDKLRRLLSETADLQIVFTESIFGMDGDQADLKTLGELKLKNPFLLILDDAHSTGVYGRAGSGLQDELQFDGLADISIVTLSKAIGSMGGAVCASTDLCDLIVNTASAYLFSTSLPPSAVASAKEALRIMAMEPQHQARVRASARYVRAALSDHFAIPAGDSPIIPLILGDERQTLAAADAARQAGFYIVAIRPPTVSPGTARLRVTLSAAHSDEEIRELIIFVKTLAPASQA